VAGWTGVGVSAFFALFAFAAAAVTAAALAGMTQAPARAMPPLFVLHAVTGGVALFAVSLQMALATPPPPARRRLHRTVGTTYVAAAAITSVATVPVVAAFPVDAVTRLAFLAEAALWLTTTAAAYAHIRSGRVERHREWMIRSFALAVFFVTFSVWDPALAALPLKPSTAYTLAVVLAWGANLAVAEAWIRGTRRVTAPVQALGERVVAMRA